MVEKMHLTKKRLFNKNVKKNCNTHYRVSENFIYWQRNFKNRENKLYKYLT